MLNSGMLGSHFRVPYVEGEYYKTTTLFYELETHLVSSGVIRFDRFALLCPKVDSKVKPGMRIWHFVLWHLE